MVSVILTFAGVRSFHNIWGKMREIYEYQPSSFQDIAFMKGMGKSTIRAISYLAEIIYGEKTSFRDPVKFSFAVGGKDGVPKPVNVADYDRAIKEHYSRLKDSPVFILGGKGRHLGEMASESMEIVATGALSESKMQFFRSITDILLNIFTAGW